MTTGRHAHTQCKSTTAVPTPTPEVLEDRLIDAEIHRRDAEQDFEIARDALYRAIIAESLAAEALERAKRGRNG